MKKIDRKHIIFCSRRGMALPFALIMLLAAGILVSVSIYIISNMAATSRVKVRDELLMNSALAGVEAVRSYILTSATGILESSVRYALTDESQLQVVNPYTGHPLLLKRRDGTEIPIFEGEIDGIPYTAFAYYVDQLQLIGATITDQDISFSSRTPSFNRNKPLVIRRPDTDPGYEEGGGGGDGGVDAGITLVLIRSRSEWRGLTKEIDQYLELEYRP